MKPEKLLKARAALASLRSDYEALDNKLSVTEENIYDEAFHRELPTENDDKDSVTPKDRTGQLWEYSYGVERFIFLVIDRPDRKSTRLNSSH